MNRIMGWIIPFLILVYRIGTIRYFPLSWEIYMYLHVHVYIYIEKPIDMH